MRQTPRVIIARGNTIWSGWAAACATSALGAVLIAAVAWSFPGPPIGAIALGLAVVLVVVASRLFVKVEGDGLTVPKGLGRARIPRTDLASLSIVESRALGLAAATSTLTAHMGDGSQQRIWVLTSFDGLPGARGSLERAAAQIANELGCPLS